MTFERIMEYFKLMVTSAVCEHLFINQLVIGQFLGYESLIANPLPIAAPLASMAALWAWWAVYKTPVTVYTFCPTCNSRVRASELTENDNG